MLDGLKLMGGAELAEIVRQTGAKAPKDAITVALLQETTLDWLAKTCSCRSSEPAEIEKSTLLAVAKGWGLELDSKLPNDQLEREVRVKIAFDSAAYLRQAWTLACVLIAAGPEAAVPAKLELLEKAASLAVPSSKARQQLVAEWQANCNKWRGTKELPPELELHFDSPERATQAFNLALVIALADGRLAVEEEHLFKILGGKMGKSHAETVESMRKISALFWDNEAKARPSKGGESPSADQDAALRAAELTLGTGLLEGFVLEAGEKLSGQDEIQENAPKSGWRKILGALSGFSDYVSHKISSENQALMTRIVYLCILRQHGKHVMELAAKEYAAEVEAHKQAKAQAQKQVFSEVGSQSTLKADRKIVLDDYWQ